MTLGTPPVALTIAGSDSGGGAGIQADLATFARFGVFGTSVITAVTAQNTRRVSAWEPVSPGMVMAQVDAVVEDLRPAAVKSGMLGSAMVADAVADAVRRHALAPYVLDPVLASGTGTSLLDDEGVLVLVTRLIPLAALVTPNLDEAERLLGLPVRDVEAMERAARRLVDTLGAGAALVKGGHLSGDELVDVLYDGIRLQRFAHARIVGPPTHGTGCTLSAAITARLALGATLEEAVERGIAFLQRAIAAAPALGAGRRPLDRNVEA